MKACVLSSDNDSQQQLNSSSLIPPSGHRVTESWDLDPSPWRWRLKQSHAAKRPSRHMEWILGAAFRFFHHLRQKKKRRNISSRMKVNKLISDFLVCEDLRGALWCQTSSAFGRLNFWHRWPGFVKACVQMSRTLCVVICALWVHLFGRPCWQCCCISS